MSDTKPKTISIDLTPEGAKTPEGVARINAAMKAQEDAILRCANALDELVRKAKDVDYIRQLTNSEELEDAEKAIKARRVAQEEFLRAVCGRETVEQEQARLRARQPRK